MRIVGCSRPGSTEVQVAALSEDGSELTVLAPLAEFWSDAAGYLSREARRADGRGHGRATGPTGTARTPG